jgi:uncharacterized protein (TIGR02145 family)
MLTLPGNQSLHLNGSKPVTGESGPGKIRFHPNPMYDYSLMEFESQAAGPARIALYDVSGRIVTEINRQLLAGLHTFRISGTLGGVYLVRIQGTGYSSFGKLISTNYGNEEAEITYEKTVGMPALPEGMERAVGRMDMTWQEGDVLQFTFISGNMRTTVIDIPAESKVLTASFLASDDIDNNHYSTIVIGAQTWMSENLKTTRLNDGTAITLATENSLWASLSVPGYCWRSNDETTYKNPYGALYNWHTVNTGKLCPTGWRVPGEGDWTTLELYLGGRNVAGGKLKEDGTWHWNGPNTGARDNYGFAMIGGGYRDGQGGGFYELGKGGYLWSALEENSTDGRWRGFSYDNIQMDLGHSVKTTGMSVRCLLDEAPPEPNPGTISDYEGNVYKTVLIGKQTWMAENLRNTHLANGERIPELKTAAEWVSVTTPGFSWRNNNEAAYKIPYGALYNGMAMISTSLCPSGYHIPTEKDFLDLEKYLGGRSLAGGKLKENGTRHWASPNTGATNSYGFTMLPGGYRSGEGSAGFFELGRGGYLWAYPYINVTPGGPRYWGFNKDYAYTDQGKNNNLNTGYSARCLKDDPTLEVPQVVTGHVLNITSHTAIVSGSCLAPSVFARGFCLSTDPDPDTNDLHTEVWYNNYYSEFRDTLTDLLPSKVYYVRAYAFRTNGIGYGAVMMFKTLPSPEEEYITDIDGNTYKTVKIGNQVWMAENLKTTRYADGTPLEKGTRASKANGNYYYYYDDDSTYKKTYGLLYSWYGAVTRSPQGVCPSGWHIPDSAENQELINFIGGRTAGGKLKETGFEHWLSPNAEATNETDFTAFGAGIYSHTLEMLEGYGYKQKGIYTVFWGRDTYEGLDFTNVYAIGLNTYNGRVFSNLDIHCGASVRCLKDSPAVPEEDLVAWYPFTGNANDSSGKDHHGTVHGSTLTTDRFGKENQAYYFDGSSYIDVPDHPDFDFDPSTSFSIACWIKLANRESEYVTVVQKGIQNATQYRISIGSGSDPGVIFAISKENSEAALYRPVPLTINDDAWHFVVALINREEKSMKLYQDGDLSTEFTVDAAGDFDLSSEATFKMGTGDYIYFFRGYMDDVRVYRRAINATEVKELYHEKGF